MNIEDDEEEEDEYGGYYENGYWVWDDAAGSLIFLSNVPARSEVTAPVLKAPAGKIKFNDDVDLIEQVRYQRRYQRRLRPGEPDIVTLQVSIFYGTENKQADVKDIALFTAPIEIMSPMLINILHIHTAERFLRALILYISYHLQVANVMTTRIIEQDKKIRTLESEKIEIEYRKNLSDLRLLVAKEYYLILIGSGDAKRFHHMGPTKKHQSLLDKDARFIESLLAISIQIVWLALGRRNLSEIELEVHRLFKSDVFNIKAHKHGLDHSEFMTAEYNVLYGTCVPHARKIKMQSPLMNEMFCRKNLDFHLTGLGVVDYKDLSSRLQYLCIAIAAEEEAIAKSDVVLGIIGLPRPGFDTMLRPIPQAPDTKSLKSGIIKSSRVSSVSMGSKKSTQSVQIRLFPDIQLPSRSSVTARKSETQIHNFSLQASGEFKAGNNSYHIYVELWIRVMLFWESDDDDKSNRSIAKESIDS